VGEEQCSAHSLSIHCWSAGLTRGTPIIGSWIGAAMVLCLLWSIKFLQRFHVHGGVVVVDDGWCGAETLSLERGSQPGVAGCHCSTMCELQKFFGSQLRLDGARVKLLQQVPVVEPLAVPLATLDSKLQPNNMPMMCFSSLFRCGIVEPVVHSVRQNIYT
jgi:hypothetical protein